MKTERVILNFNISNFEGVVIRLLLILILVDHFLKKVFTSTTIPK